MTPRGHITICDCKVYKLILYIVHKRFLSTNTLNKFIFGPATYTYTNANRGNNVTFFFANYTVSCLFFRERERTQLLLADFWILNNLVPTRMVLTQESRSLIKLTKANPQYLWEPNWNDLQKTRSTYTFGLMKSSSNVVWK